MVTITSSVTTADGATTAPADEVRPITYEPGLDGLRAVALLSIYVVHADLGLAPGGFLAVSTFFTLSGFLITALLATEHARHGKIDLKAFWLRRARRLLPASLLAIAGIVVVSILIGSPVQNDNLPGDVLGSLAYVANWRFLAADISYGATYADQSPLLHFWSLAIEEQFYLVFPLLGVAAFAVRKRWKPGAFVVLGLGALASLVAGIVGVASDSAPDHLYFRTDIRAGELLVGALFGLWWVKARHTMSEALHQAIQLAGGVLLVLMVSLIATSDYHDKPWYQGGLLAYSLVTVGVVLAAVEPKGVVRRLLSWRPLVLAGMVSYAAYLVHWPIFLWLRTQTDVPGGVRLVGGTAVSLAIAALSHRLVESPIRHKRLYPAPVLAFSAVALLAFSIGVGSQAPSWSRDKEVPLADAKEEVERDLEITAAAPGEAPTVGNFGDSTALMTTLGLVKFDNDDKTVRIGSGSAGLGCTVNAPANFMVNGVDTRSNGECDAWKKNWDVASFYGKLDVAFVQFGPWEVKEAKVDGSDTWRTIGDPEQDALIEQRLTEGIDILLRETPVIVISTSPYIEPGRVNGKPPARQQPDADHERMDRLNEIIRTVAERYPQVALLDFAGWIEESGRTDHYLPDGIHLSSETSDELAPMFARTLARIDAVAKGEAEPATAADTDLFPVLRWAEIP